LRKVTIISVMYIRPYETTALLLGAFSWILFWNFFTKIYRRN
jgi:hypothetical protein